MLTRTGTGGAAFGTFWPLRTGTSVAITQGPGGGDSHASPTTRYAVDLGVPTGTEVHAGFNGVVARVNDVCAPGDFDCGGGFGNYVLLKAVDGTCSLQAHLSRVDVTAGDQAPKYRLLGLSGYTGHIEPPDATGAHLHYDHVDCNTFASLAWAPAEGGSLAEGTTITSQNAAEPSCDAIQGGCVNPQTGTFNPQGPTCNPQTTDCSGGGDGGGTGGSTPPPPTASITASKGGPYGGGYELKIAVKDFPTGTYIYECHDDSGPGGADTAFYRNTVTVTDANQSQWPGVFCFDSAPFKAYLVMNGIRSNVVQF